MAYVANSKQLMRDVRETINDMEAAEARTVQPEVFAFDGTLDLFVAHAWGEHHKLLALLPKAWVGSFAHINLAFKTVGHDNTEIECSVNVDLSPPVPLPPNANVVGTLVIDADDPLFAKLVESQRAVYACTDRWGKVRAQILPFLENCKSLNEALKLWPQVCAYIPKAYLKKIAERKTPKEESSAGAAFLATMDTDHLTAAVVTAKLAEAQS